MIAAHKLLAALSPSAVFEALRNVGAASATQRGVGLIGLPDVPNPLSAVPPSAEIAKLLLHLAWETYGRQNVAIIFYFSQNLRKLGDIPLTEPDTTGWSNSAISILNRLRQDISITYTNGNWDIECANPSLRLVPEIRQLINQIMSKKDTISVKNSENVVVKSNLTAESIIIGDVTHHHYMERPALATPLMAKQMIQFSERLSAHINANQLVAAFEMAMAYTSAVTPDQHKAVEALYEQWRNVSEQRDKGVISAQNTELEWNRIKQALQALVQQLTTLI